MYAGARTENPYASRFNISLPGNSRYAQVRTLVCFDCRIEHRGNPEDILAAFKGHNVTYYCIEDGDHYYITTQYGNCTSCNASGLVTQAINCSHGKSASHWRCGHGENQSANYHT